ncbi:N-acetylglucosamine-6-phosphate deacetylase [Cellulomonas marina]|uniref:N-acetylglucosamine-6-phosphate deacetylase n=1 Tax=Cellulomonas marina TaxID=988821 RepID=A0A1I0WTL8_9CELL|nr:N-acetylglucosamine-6-phosphate deacetylase [Cellulomonas marina]GIG30338.1 N-acetylglucosamine-6-phosphate deacetylase [Cellulomonas marina]SFA92099.1 N-acetylglucosamine-6-phosphate deacetylase [Cellulomonas marina]
MSSTLLTHAHRVDADGEVPDGWLLVEDGRIAATGTGGTPDGHVRIGEVLDLGGALVVPGFVDLHGHGGGGASYDDGPEAARAALAAHRAHGTTRAVLSLVARPVEELARTLRMVAALAGEDPLVLGSHLEGPWLSPERHGAHEVRHLRAPLAEDVDALLDAAAGTLRQVTLAPELPGAAAAVDRLVRAGVRVAVGHTETDAAGAAAAFDAGATLLTHAFNAMPGIHHRAPGPVVAALRDPRVTLEVVLDGHHVDPALVAVLAAAAPGRLALVSDAMAGAGAPDGGYRLGGLDVLVRGGVATLVGGTTIAGSTLTLDTALRLAVTEVGLDLATAVTALTATPARVLGLDDRLGRLRPGLAADLVVLGPALAVEGVWADGRRLR